MEGISQRQAKEEKRSSKLAKIGKAGVLAASLVTAANTSNIKEIPSDLVVDAPMSLYDLVEKKSRLTPEKFADELEKIESESTLPLAIGLLAHNAHPQYRWIQADPALQNADNVPPALVYPLVKHRIAGTEYWQELGREFRRSSDFRTAEVRIAILKKISEENQNLDPIELEESVAYVARNLYMKGLEVTSQTVTAEVQAILERRIALASENIFGQDVLLISADELMGSNSDRPGGPRFGTEALAGSIQGQQEASGNVNATFTQISPLIKDASQYYETEQSVAQAKSQALTKLMTSIKPITVFFDGHGSPSAFEISPNKSMKESERSITVQELANALESRWALEQSFRAKDLQISFIFNNCYMQNFTRALAAELTQRHVPLPNITVTTAEYGQYGFSNFHNPYGSSFNEMIANNPTIGSIIEHKHDIKVSDPSIFVPRRDNPKKLMQISGTVVPQGATETA